MRAFRAVATCGSFAGAARSQAYSTAWASRLVSQLEAHLGVQLLVRTTRRLSLTEAGRLYLERCIQLLDDLDETERSLLDLQSAPRGRLRVSVPMSFGILRLSPLIPSFLSRYPDVELDVFLNDRLVDLLGEGIDVALRIGDHLDDSSLIAKRIGSGERVLCASPAYLEQNGAPEHPRDLGRHVCLRYALHAAPSRWTFDGPGGPLAVDVRGPLTVNNSLALRDAAVAGLGILLTPDFIVKEALQTQTLRRILPSWNSPGYHIHAVSPPTRFSTPKARAFVEFFSQALGASVQEQVS